MHSNRHIRGQLRLACRELEVLALIGLRNRDLLVRRNAERIRAGVGALRASFTDPDRLGRHFRWAEPRGGTFAYPALRRGGGGGGGGGGTEALCEKLLEEHSIMLVPSMMFGDGDDRLRITYGRDGMPELLERLERAVLACS